jgi:hypothetical protein
MSSIEGSYQSLCDRCNTRGERVVVREPRTAHHNGSTMIYSAPGWVFLDDVSQADENGRHRGHRFDLCPDCARDLYAFLNTKQKATAT